MLKKFNQAHASPKDITGKVKQFSDWKLGNFIDVSRELGLIEEDVKKYCHTLREFRNYIHPYEQMASNFHPNKHTARMSWVVLQATIYYLSGGRN